MIELRCCELSADLRLPLLRGCAAAVLNKLFERDDEEVPERVCVTKSFFRSPNKCARLSALC